MFSHGCLLSLGQSDIFMGGLGVAGSCGLLAFRALSNREVTEMGPCEGFPCCYKQPLLTSISETQPMGTRNYVKIPNGRIQRETMAGSFCSSLLFVCVCLHVSVSKAL